MHFARSIVLGYHSIPKIKWGSFRGRREEKWGSFQGWGSFRGLYILETPKLSILQLRHRQGQRVTRPAVSLRRGSKTGPGRRRKSSLRLYYPRKSRRLPKYLCRKCHDDNIVCLRASRADEEPAQDYSRIP